MQRLEERVQQVEMEGWGKMREAVAGSEVEGFYGLLRGVTSHSHLLPSPPPSKKPWHAPSATISKSSPWESTGPKVSNPADQAMGPASPVALSALEEAIPAQCNPSIFRWGASNECTDARLRAARRAHQPHGPLFVPM